MPISITDKYNLNKADFMATGAFDVILDVDSRLFIDPALLEKCDTPEFLEVRKRLRSIFPGSLLFFLTRQAAWMLPRWKNT